MGDALKGEYLSKRDRITRNQKVVNPSRIEKAEERMQEELDDWATHLMNGGSEDTFNAGKRRKRTGQQFVNGKWRCPDHSLSNGSKPYYRNDATTGRLMNGFGETPEEVKVKLELEKQERVRVRVKAWSDGLKAFYVMPGL